MSYAKLEEKKQQLDAYRPLPPELIDNLDDWFRVELTYTSNAIEGNTLTRSETALVLEKGLTVGGKSLTEHLEAKNHASALDFLQKLLREQVQHLDNKDVLDIHRIVLRGIDDANAGHFRTIPVRISGSTVILPNPRKVPDLMAEFQAWLKAQKSPIFPTEFAAEAHYRLVTIHPFIDGNGRTARLLMNLILMMFGYPPAIIRKQDRLKYINALENAQLGGTKDDYLRLIEKAVERSLDIYLKAAQGQEADAEKDAESDELLTTGNLAKQAGESNSTIRHWTKMGLLEVSEVTKSGYQKYSAGMLERIKEIKRLQKERYALAEIKEELRG